MWDGVVWFVVVGRWYGMVRCDVVEEVVVRRMGG